MRRMADQMWMVVPAQKIFAKFLSSLKVMEQI
jgi:hypothetical protein